MRVLVTAEPQFPIPQEQFPALVQGFLAWREQYRSKMESFYFFATGSGGGGVLNVADEAELFQIMAEWPFNPFSSVKSTPILDGDEGLQRLQRVVQTMMGGSR
jgi:hypothetical protein